MLMSRTQWRTGQLMPATLTQYWGVFYMAFALTAWLRRDATTSVIGWMNAQWGESFVAGYLLTMFIVGVVLLIRPVPVKVFALGSVWFVLYTLISFPVVIQDVGIPYEPLVVYSGLWVLSIYWVFYDHGFPHVPWRKPMGTDCHAQPFDGGDCGVVWLSTTRPSNWRHCFCGWVVAGTRNLD